MKKIAGFAVLFLAITVMVIQYYKTGTHIKLNPMQLNSLSFNLLVKEIDQKVVDLTAPGDLLDIVEFKQILSNPTHYKSEAISFLANPNNTSQSKKIVCYSMQSLEGSSFFCFLNECAQLYSQGKISEDVIKVAILPGNEWNNRIIIKFYSKSVKQALLLVKGKESTSKELRRIIDEIITGHLALRLVLSSI